MTRWVRLNWDAQSPTTTAIETTYTHDDLGNVMSVTVPGGIGAATRTATMEYDDLNRAKRTILPALEDGTVLDVEYSYDLSGNLNKVTNPAGDMIQYEYNLENELIKVTVPIDSGRSAETDYTYDRQSRLTSVKDALARERYTDMTMQTG